MQCLANQLMLLENQLFNIIPRREEEFVKKKMHLGTYLLLGPVHKYLQDLVISKEYKLMF